MTSFFNYNCTNMHSHNIFHKYTVYPVCRKSSLSPTGENKMEQGQTNQQPK